MGLYNIVYCTFDDKSRIQAFINNHWKVNHSLVVSSELLEFQHLSADGRSFHYIAAENNETKEFDAIIGYIPTSQYDTGLLEKGDYWGAIWKIREDISNSEINTVGFFLWKKMFKLPYFNSYGAIGISNIAKQIYEASRLEIGYLKQYYIVNEAKTEFSIAKNITPKQLNEDRSNFSIKEIKLDEIVNNIINPAYSPQKSITYFKNRYELHPIYNYKFLGIFDNNKTLISVWAVRFINVNDSSVVRVIDVLGDLNGINNIYSQIQELLSATDAEYIDFMNHGIPAKIFKKMGFEELNLEDNIILPNYFEPFEQRNVKIELAYKADFDYVVFKGDADQDRPNIINSL
ncbi:MAG: hypothetical protein PHE29_00145 [Tissierellia bacterium]|nr:hypothetical protein [Tissierellia bacterium]MDD4781030.1 hypothetical protein [Tissierellia bacterium]